MDKIGDLLNRIATANPNAKEIKVPNSKQKRAILKVLYEEGWIAGVTEDKQGESSQALVKELIVFLKRPYIDASNKNWTTFNPKISRISKPGRRIYSSAKLNEKLLASVSNLASTIVISTSQGIMPLNQAVERNLGGELLFKISM